MLNSVILFGGSLENFKSIVFDETNFTVGDLGTVYRDGKPAVIVTTPDGYHQVSCKHRSIGVHRLVAMCFVDGRTDSKNEVNHKDFNRQNNRSDNLEWMTHAENIRYSAQFGTPKDISGEKNPNWGNKKLSEYYKENPDAAKEKQGRPGSKNGRAKPVDVFLGNEHIGHFEYIGQCWEYMRDHYGFDGSPETLRLGIRRANKHNRTYKGFTFIT